jgi:hypothetical protein
LGNYTFTNNIEHDDIFYNENLLLCDFIHAMGDQCNNNNNNNNVNTILQLVDVINHHPPTRSISGEHKELSILFVVDGCDNFIPYASSSQKTYNRNSTFFPDSIEANNGRRKSEHNSNDHKHRRALITIVNTLLKRTEGAKFLLTSNVPLLDGEGEFMTHEPEKEVLTRPLSRIESAELLIRLSPRPIKPEEINPATTIASSNHNGNTLEIFSQRSIFCDLAGNPRAIFLFATSLKSRDIDDSIDIRNLAREKYYKAVEWKESRGRSMSHQGVMSSPQTSSPMLHHSIRPLSSKSQLELHHAPHAQVPLRSTKSSSSINFDNNATSPIDDFMHAAASTTSSAQNTRPTVQRDLETARTVASTMLTDPSSIEAWAILTASPISVPVTNTNPPLRVVKWNHVVTELSKMVRANLQLDDYADTKSPPRQIGPDDWNFVRDRIEPEAAVSNILLERRSSDYIVDLPKFKKLCDWFCPLLRTLKYLRNEFLSSSPILIHGFISRQKSEMMLLETGLSGMFLLRFSESRPGLLVVSLTDYADTSDENCRYVLKIV